MEDKFLAELRLLYLRDLDRLEKEIIAYPDEELLWRLEGDIKNSGGTLCLHLCGNLQHYLGTILGNTGYRRNRDNEFAARNIPRHELLAEIANTKEAITSTFRKLDHSVLDKEYPEQIFGHPMTTSFFLLHLLSHLNYHLGQVNYHRRMISTIR